MISPQSATDEKALTMIVNLAVTGIIRANGSACSELNRSPRPAGGATRPLFAPCKPCVGETQISAITLQYGAGDATRAASVATASADAAARRHIKKGVLPQSITLMRDTHCIFGAHTYFPEYRRTGRLPPSPDTLPPG